MRGHTKFLGGLKNRGGKAFRGPVTKGCFGRDVSSYTIECKYLSEALISIIINFTKDERR